MKPEHAVHLVTAYPDIFPRRFARFIETGIARFDCCDGWFALLDELCAALQLMNHRGRQVVIHRAYTKHGGLRLDVGQADDRQQAIIDFAENMSERICEACAATLAARKQLQMST